MSNSDNIYDTIKMLIQDANTTVEDLITQKLFLDFANAIEETHVFFENYEIEKTYGSVPAWVGNFWKVLNSDQLSSEQKITVREAISTLFAGSENIEISEDFLRNNISLKYGSRQNAIYTFQGALCDAMGENCPPVLRKSQTYVSLTNYAYASGESMPRAVRKSVYDTVDGLSHYFATMQPYSDSTQEKLSAVIDHTLLQAEKYTKGMIALAYGKMLIDIPDPVVKEYFVKSLADLEKCHGPFHVHDTGNYPPFSAYSLLLQKGTSINIK